MNKRLASAISVLASFIAAPAWAQSQCATFEMIGNRARTNYNPFANAPTVEVFDLKLRRTDPSVSRVRFLLTDVAPHPDGPGIGLLGPSRYDIEWADDSTRKAFTAGSEPPMALISPEVALQGRGAGVEVTRFRWIVPAGQEAPAGEHREQLTVRYQCLDNMGRALGPIQEQSFGIDLVLRVPRYVSAFIGSAGGTRGAISFGPISATTSDLSRTIGITAMSTLPYRVEFESQNGQKLKRNRNASDGIDYLMSYAGTEVSDGDRLTCPMTRAPMGTVKEFQVVLDRSSVARQPAGTHRDRVTLTFTPRDVAPVSSCVPER